MFGTVVDTNKVNGYAFIRPDDGSEDVFAHFREFRHRLEWDYLDLNARVEFETYDHPRGVRAKDIRVVPQ